MFNCKHVLCTYEVLCELQVVLCQLILPDKLHYILQSLTAVSYIALHSAVTHSCILHCIAFCSHSCMSHCIALCSNSQLYVTLQSLTAVYHTARPLVLLGEWHHLWYWHWNMFVTFMCDTIVCYFRIVVLFLYRAISAKLNFHNYLSAVPYNMHCVVSNNHPVWLS
jgi:hypothetical protein